MTPTSNPSWLTCLRQSLSRLDRSDHPLRLALVGIGHELRGDDAAGPAVAAALQEHLPDPVLVLNAGPAPENCTGPLRRFAPDWVLLIDAAQMEAPPGTVNWLDAAAADSLGLATHSLPLALFAQYLSTELHCAVALLGIQPAQMEVAAPLSPAVQAAVAAVTQGVRAACRAAL